MATVTDWVVWSFLAVGTIALSGAGILWLVLRHREKVQPAAAMGWQKAIRRGWWEIVMALALFFGCVFVFIGVTVLQVTGN